MKVIVVSSLNQGLHNGPGKDYGRGPPGKTLEPLFGRGPGGKTLEPLFFEANASAA